MCLDASLQNEAPAASLPTTAVSGAAVLPPKSCPQKDVLGVGTLHYQHRTGEWEGA